MQTRQKIGNKEDCPRLTLTKPVNAQVEGQYEGIIKQTENWDPWGGMRY